MKNYKLFLITTVICLLPILFALSVYSELPQEMPTHWNSAGEINDYMPKQTVVFILPFLLAVLNAIVFFSLENDPKKSNFSIVLKRISIWIIPVVAVIVQLTSILAALGHEVPIQVIAPAICSVLFIAVGNYLPKCKQNYTVGIKLPWTLNSEANWNKTHHLAGYLWMICGFLMLIGCFLPGFNKFFLVCVFAMVLIPAAYSFILYKKGL